MRTRALRCQIGLRSHRLQGPWAEMRVAEAAAMCSAAAALR